MATYKPDFPEGEPSTSDRDRAVEGIHGGKKSKGNARRARARRARASRRVDTAGVVALGSIPTPNQSNAAHSLNQPRQVWRPRAVQNVRLSTPAASTNAPYPADDVQGEGSNINVDHEMVEGGEPQAGTLSSLAEIFYPNQLQDTPLAGILDTPSRPLVIPASGHQLPAMHDHLPAISTPPPNIIPYCIPGYVPCPPGYELQYPVGIVQYPYVQYYIPPYW